MMRLKIILNGCVLRETGIKEDDRIIIELYPNSK